MKLFSPKVKGLASVMLALGVVSTSISAMDLDSLLLKLRNDSDTEARFVELSQHRLSDEPVRYEGILRMTADGLLFEKVVEHPLKLRLTITKDTVTVSQKSRERTQPLSARPELEAIAAAMRGVLLADRTALDATFRVTLSGTAEDWSLALEPSAKNLAKLMTLITVSGHASGISSIDTTWANGDWQEMRLLP